LDWVVNGIFYSALHYLDSYFASKGENPDTHEERNHLIAERSELGQPFFHLYRDLKNDSEDGRYRMRIFTPNEVRNDILPVLDKVKTYLGKFIPEILN